MEKFPHHEKKANTKTTSAAFPDYVPSTMDLSTKVALKNSTKSHWEATQVTRKIQYVASEILQ